MSYPVVRAIHQAPLTVHGAAGFGIIGSYAKSGGWVDSLLQNRQRLNGDWYSIVAEVSLERKR